MNVLEFAKMKQQNKKISMITCYDYWSARIIAQTSIDCILVGDSSAMVMHGHQTTIPANVEMIATHVQAVAKGAPNKFIVGDLPFLSYRKGLIETMQAVETLMKAGSHALKLEGAEGNFANIEHIVESGVPVMGHLGLTPQAIHALGGFKVQGKDSKVAEKIRLQAQQLQDAGCFAIVFECVPYLLAKDITEMLTIPTIGIGAGPYTSGQVLVLQDMLGMIPESKFKFMKKYLEGYNIIKDSLNAFDDEVKAQVFPNIEEHCYGT